MRLCILIPLHNEAQNIGQLLDELRTKGLDVCVIDDGSTDSSGAIAKGKGAVVLVHEKKMGKGISLRDGFHYVLEQNYNGVITMDGDGQHAVKDLDQFIAKASDVPSSVIVGTRMKNSQGMPWIRLVVNRLMSSMISAVCRQDIPDTQCGFRYIGRDILKTMDLTSKDFEIESEVLIQSSRRGFKIYSVPIQTIYRNESSKINPFIDTIRFLVYIARETLFSKSKRSS